MAHVREIGDTFTEKKIDDLMNENFWIVTLFQDETEIHSYRQFKPRAKDSIWFIKNDDTIYLGFPFYTTQIFINLTTRTVYDKNKYHTNNPIAAHFGMHDKKTDDPYTFIDGFIWCNFELSADKNLILASGCYWACPGETKLYDIHNLENGWNDIYNIFDECGQIIMTDKYIFHVVQEYTIAPYSNTDTICHYGTEYYFVHKQFEYKDGKLVLVENNAVCKCESCEFYNFGCDKMYEPTCEFSGGLTESGVEYKLDDPLITKYTFDDLEKIE